MRPQALSTAAVCALLLAGCTAGTVQTYGVSADTNHALRSLSVKQGIGVSDFSLSGPIDLTCRAVGPIALPPNTTFPGYIRKAFEDELKLAGMFGAASPKVTLRGNIHKVDMSSSAKGLFTGYWSIGLTVSSSNGKEVSVNDYYEFESAFNGVTACSNTANALMPAVQSLINKGVKDPNFIALLQ